MRKMTDYKIAFGADIRSLATTIRTMIAKGYEPAGNVFVSGTSICQTIVQYDGTPATESPSEDASVV